MHRKFQGHRAGAVCCVRPRGGGGEVAPRWKPRSRPDLGVGVGVEGGACVPAASQAAGQALRFHEAGRLPDPYLSGGHVDYCNKPHDCRGSRPVSAPRNVKEASERPQNESTTLPRVLLPKDNHNGFSWGWERAGGGQWALSCVGGGGGKRRKGKNTDFSFQRRSEASGRTQGTEKGGRGHPGPKA